MQPADHRAMAGGDDRAPAGAAPADLPVTPVDPAAEARRLALLTGADAPAVLAAALRVAGAELVSSRARQVVHQPGRGTTVAYRCRVRWPDGEVGDERLAACTGEVPEGALVLGDGADRVAVWRFPHDPELPGLAAACDEAAVASLLDELGLGGGSVRLRTRAYRPRRRAVIEAVGSRGRLFIKVMRPDRVEALHDRHRLLVRSGIPAPQSLGWTPQGILVLQALPGRTLRHALRGRTLIPAAGDILALLDLLPRELARGTPRQSWLDKAPHYAAVIGAALPAQAARAARLGEQLADAADGLARAGPVHGDFYESQLLVDRGRICGVLDVDTAGPGDKLDDLACLLGHLSVLAQIDQDRAPIINRAGAAYLRAFEAVAPPPALRHRVAAVVVSLATGSHRVQERGWPATTRRRLDLAESWLASARELTRRR
jgi:aminoglycoside phosphotransferase